METIVGMREKAVPRQSHVSWGDIHGTAEQEDELGGPTHMDCPSCLCPGLP